MLPTNDIRRLAASFPRVRANAIATPEYSHNQFQFHETRAYNMVISHPLGRE